jgi:hypothetical protein
VGSSTFSVELGDRLQVPGAAQPAEHELGDTRVPERRGAVLAPAFAGLAHDYVTIRDRRCRGGWGERAWDDVCVPSSVSMQAGGLSAPPGGAGGLRRRVGVGATREAKSGAMLRCPAPVPGTKTGDMGSEMGSEMGSRRRCAVCGDRRGP